MKQITSASSNRNSIAGFLGELTQRLGSALRSITQGVAAPSLGATVFTCNVLALNVHIACRPKQVAEV